MSEWGPTQYRTALVSALGGKCEECGTKESLEIHHIDRDRSNNSYENLELLCFDCHKREHYDTLVSVERTENVDVEKLGELVAETTAARGVDLHAVEVCGLSAAEWGRVTDRDRSTVATNVRRGVDSR
jgi:hypothetical protein